MRLLIPEVFDKVEQAKTKEEKIKILRQNDSQPLRAMLFLNFNKEIKWQIPEGEPPYKKVKDTPVGLSETNLYVEARRIYVFTNPKLNLTKYKREALFIEMLEAIHWTEAEMLCAVKDKTLTKKYKSLKEALVREAFPALLPEPEPEESAVKK